MREKELYGFLVDCDLMVGRGIVVSLFIYEIEEGKYFYDVDNMKFFNKWINVNSIMIFIYDERINKKSVNIIFLESFWNKFLVLFFFFVIEYVSL